MCEYPSFFNEDIVTARKPHVCDECHRAAIRVGDSYQRIVGKWDGMISTIRTCAKCQRVRGLVNSRLDVYEPYFTDDCGLMLGDLYEVIRNKVRDIGAGHRAAVAR